MSGTSEIADRLAGLSDGQLVAVLLAATAGRPGLEPVRAAVLDLADTGDAIRDEMLTPVTPATLTADESDAVQETGESGQVDGASAVPIPSAVDTVIGGYSTGGVPTFESVRDKVEQRFGTAQGLDELDRQTPAGRSADEQWEAREHAARERLDRIRKSVHDNDIDTDEP